MGLRGRARGRYGSLFYLGTGVGGGLVVNGRLQLGIRGTAGELGHQVIDVHGPPCGCGGRGCLEVFASGPAITALGIKAVLQGLTPQIGSLVDYDLNRITPQVKADAALEGDAVACEIFERVGTYLGIGVANVIIAVGPRRVIWAGAWRGWVTCCLSRSAARCASGCI
jgi:glucokinase